MPADRGQTARRSYRPSALTDTWTISRGLVAVRACCPMTRARHLRARCDAPADSGGETARPLSDTGPARLSEHVATLRTFGVLMLGGLLGVVALQPYALALTPPRLPPGSPPLAWAPTNAMATASSSSR